MIRKLALIAALSTLGCGGGGGGGGSDSGTFAGVWDYNIQPSRNSCNQSGVDPLSGVATINQDGPRIVVDARGNTYSGAADSDGFLATAIGTSSCDGDTPASINYEIEFSQPEGADFGGDEAAVF